MLRYWKWMLGIALVIWLGGTAWMEARRRGRHAEGAALAMLVGAVALFLAAAFFPRPPMTQRLAILLLIASVALVAGAISYVVVQGFRASGAGRPWRR